MKTCMRRSLYLLMAQSLLLLTAIGAGVATKANAAPLQHALTVKVVGQVTDCTPGPDKILTGCVYDGQNIAGADFSRSDLTAATFNGANVSGSNFSDANLTEATLDGANLSCSNFNGANLTATTLDGANLLGSTFEGALFVSTTFGTSTTCPDGTISGDHGNSCVDNLQPIGCGAEEPTETTVAVDTATAESESTATAESESTATAESDTTPDTGGETPSPPSTGLETPPSELPNTGVGSDRSGGLPSGLVFVPFGLLMVLTALAFRRKERLNHR